MFHPRRENWNLQGETPRQVFFMKKIINLKENSEVTPVVDL